jgi:hypothetical protein
VHPPPVGVGGDPSFERDRGAVAELELRSADVPLALAVEMPDARADLDVSARDGAALELRGS